MKILNDAFLESFRKSFTNKEFINLTEEEMIDILSKTGLNVSETVSQGIVDEQCKIAKKALKSERKKVKRFTIRNIKRWKGALDLLEYHMLFCQELGEQFHADYFDELTRREPYKLDVLITLHGRALLVAREILCLLKNGYADGALARWRSLHEIAVVSLFINEHDDNIAERYNVSSETVAHKGMKQYQEYHKRAGLKAFSTTELEEQHKAFNAVLKKYGDEMKNDYGWSVPALKTNKKNPNLFDLEKSIELDHLRPYYKLASQYTHGNFKHPATLLGVCEVPLENEPAILVGPSDSGLTDPIGLTAISLQQVTMALTFLEPSFGAIVGIKALKKIEEKLSSALTKAENK